MGPSTISMRSEAEEPNTATPRAIPCLGPMGLRCEVTNVILRVQSFNFLQAPMEGCTPVALGHRFSGMKHLVAGRRLGSEDSAGGNWRRLPLSPNQPVHPRVRDLAIHDAVFAQPSVPNRHHRTNPTPQLVELSHTKRIRESALDPNPDHDLISVVHSMGSRPN